MMTLLLQFVTGHSETWHEDNLHEAYGTSLRETFVGRHKLLKQAMEKLKTPETGLIMLHGKPGSGKSAFMVYLSTTTNLFP